MGCGLYMDLQLWLKLGIITNPNVIVQGKQSHLLGVTYTVNQMSYDSNSVALVLPGHRVGSGWVGVVSVSASQSAAPARGVPPRVCSGGAPGPPM